MNGSISFTLAEPDLVAGYRFVSRCPRKTWFMLVTCSVVTCMIAVFILSSTQVPPNIRSFGQIPLWFVAAGWVVQGAIHVLMNSPLWRSRFKILIGQYDVSWNETHVIQASPLGTVQCPWSRIQRWKQDDHFVVLYTSGWWYCLLPKRAMSQETLNALIQILIDTVGAQQGTQADAGTLRGAQ